MRSSQTDGHRFDVCRDRFLQTSDMSKVLFLVFWHWAKFWFFLLLIWVFWCFHLDKSVFRPLRIFLRLQKIWKFPKSHRGVPILEAPILFIHWIMDKKFQVKNVWNERAIWMNQIHRELYSLMWQLYSFILHFDEIFFKSREEFMAHETLAEN